MRFGKYELGDLIARGGMAEVFSARLHGAEGFVKPVAIKRIREPISSDPEFVRLFVDEARLVAGLRHVNIVQIHDFDVVEGSYYLAMELVEGKDLRRLMNRAVESGRRLSPELGLHVAAEVAKGLMAAHERCDDDGRPLGIVHRDLSPHNILVSFAGEVKVTDFGIAKAMAASVGQDSGSEVIRGKLAYMSPEQVRGEEVDQRSDLFSLGLVLYELTTGRRRYMAQDEAGLVRQVAEAALPDPSQVNAAISPGLNALLRRLLSPRPVDRPRSARDVVEALRGVEGAGDRSLELASLLERLFPDEAEAARRSQGWRERREARGEARATADPGGASPASAEADDASDLAAAAITASTRARWRGRLWMSVGVGVLLVAALVLWSLGAWPFGGASLPPPRSAHQRDARTAHGANAGGDPTRGASGPRAAEAGALEVLSDPPGAIVSVDGLPTGRRTPARLGVRPGRHQVLVRWDDGGEAQEERLVHAREKLTVHLSRSASPPGNRRPPGPPAPSARRRVRGTAADPGSPGEAARAADGARRAPPPEVATPTPPGTSAPAGRRDVRSSPGAVQFLCRPWALVSVSGQELGQTPVGRVLAPGTHRVTFRNDSLGQREEVTITVRAGDRPRRVECHFGAGK